ncbi:hypothetical protein BD560DRAFT_403773 [Blakeslea trispora]|nr:hypothetical protein BD560DRAFT_403773 [Blakeslea trispora]
MGSIIALSFLLSFIEYNLTHKYYILLLVKHNQWYYLGYSEQLIIRFECIPNSTHTQSHSLVISAFINTDVEILTGSFPTL